jgi:2,3-bisphosphoglycerate-independent phosphoglycerate mutase
MPSESDMGNSEVGHNAIGAGRVFAQGAKLVQEAIDSGRLFEGETWKEQVAWAKEHDGALHFIGLHSDGNVHTHVEHLYAMLRRAKQEGVKKARVHALLDGRDVPPQSADVYLRRTEEVLAELNEDGTVDYAIASGGGRLWITMDRYEADWPMVERGWNTHVHGRGREFTSALEAVEALRADQPGAVDQDLKEFVIVRDGKPVGPVNDGDSVILFNFRGDRAMELTRAFERDDFDKFDRGRRPDVKFSGMMEYDGDLHVPAKFLVSPSTIDRTMGEYLAQAGVSQLAVSETQKFGHVTYFFNGNRTDKFDEALETYVEVPSDQVPFEQRPWMKAAEITDVAIETMRKGSARFVRLNYPNGDMVGHTGNNLAVEISVEAVDLGVQRLMKAARETGSILVISADHGNADEMFEVDKDGQLKTDAEGNPKPKTAHTLNPVPVFLFDPDNQAGIKLSAAAEAGGLGISSLAATCLNLLGFDVPEGYDPSLVEVG